MPPLRLFSFLSLLLICAPSSAVAVSAQQNPAPTRLALEVTYFPGRKPAYQPVPGPDAKLGGARYGMFGHVGPPQPRADVEPVEAVRILSRVEGDAVRVIVSTLSGRKALEKEQQVGTYLLCETEKMNVEDLRQFGIEPFGIRLIRVTPNIAPVPPVVLKGVESLVVVSAVANESTLPSYTIKLLNQSNKNVIAVGVDVVAAGRIAITARPQGTEGQPLIAAGKSHALTVRAPSRADGTADGYAPTTPSKQQIEIKAAVFDDGTYEGDARTAAAVKGYRAGDKMELSRMIALLENAINSSETDVTAAVRNLAAQVSSVSSDAEPGLVQSLLSEFPQFDKAAAGNMSGDTRGDASISEEIKRSIEFSAETLNSNLLKEIQKLQAGGSPSNGAPALAAHAYRAWLVSTKAHYEQWLARL